MLDRIVAHKRMELDTIDRHVRIETLKRKVAFAAPAVSLKHSLTGESGVAVIAEIKRHSPSKGSLADNLPVKQMVDIYERAGVRGISVLTEAEFFRGSIADLQAAKSSTRLPVLRKDFILDEYQVWESRYIGADAILLIAAILSFEELASLHALAGQIGLEVLIEVHSAAEIEKALAANPEMIGINNRDLRTFAVNLRTSEKLRPLIPADIVCVSESGIKRREDIDRLAAWGINAFLVGEAIVTSPDPMAKVRELVGNNDDQD